MYSLSGPQLLGYQADRRFDESEVLLPFSAFLLLWQAMPLIGL